MVLSYNDLSYLIEWHRKKPKTSLTWFSMKVYLIIPVAKEREGTV